MIEQIEKLHPKLKPVLLPDLKLFGDDEIPVLLERPAPGIAWSVAVTGRSGSGRERHIRGSREACWIEIVFKPSGKRASGVSILCVCAKEGGSAASGVAVGAPAGAISDREWQTTLIGDYAAHTPALKDLVVKEGLTRYREVVEIGDH